MRALVFVLVVGGVALGCDSGRDVDADASSDARTSADTSTSRDTSASGDASTDASASGDARTSGDASTSTDASNDAGTSVDAFVALDSGRDAFASIDGGHDAFVSVDVGHDAASSGGCVSGALGTRAVRFRWLGSGPGSTAYVDYELDQLPDTSRWHVSSASSSFSYTPTFDDTFLAEGGLDLEGTAFIDVELSTVGLASVSRATIAIYGRSFDTTTSGSFHWQTFHGTGAAPNNLVANSAPYEWYLADATAQLPAGDGTTLLRIYPGPSSGALIVARVEICFAP